MSLPIQEAAQLHLKLQQAVIKCSERCLYQSAKWAAELLDSISQTWDEVGRPSLADIDNSDSIEAVFEAQEAPRYLLAKSFFECREFERCAATFLSDPMSESPTIMTDPLIAKPTRPKEKQTTNDSPPDGIRSDSKPAILSLSQRSLFLVLYAKLLAGEKRKDEEVGSMLGPQDQHVTFNDQLRGITRLLETWFQEREERDDQHSDIGGSQGWLEYLYGVVLAKGKDEERAMEWLIKSANINPWHWGTWQEIGGLIVDVEQFNRIQRLLSPSVMAIIFHLWVCQELYQPLGDVQEEARRLENVFRESTFLKTQRALLHFHNKDFEEAESIFGGILRSDSHCLDGLHHHSNILHVMNQRPKLALLAQLGTSVDQYRPESCCAIGNYYSRISEHEKAVVYYRRALTLDRRFPSAWTLLGHEYTAMKNTHAAVESYRRAVDVDRKDFRAWYGLGRAYESLELHTYALYYYQRASTLRPYDAAIWQALGRCFRANEQPRDAVKALKRALLAKTGPNPASDMEDAKLDPETVYQIAKAYEQDSNLPEACAFMALCVAQESEGLHEEQEEGMSTEHDDETPEAAASRTAISEARDWLTRRGPEVGLEDDGWQALEADDVRSNLKATAVREAF